MDMGVRCRLGGSEVEHQASALSPVSPAAEYKHAAFKTK